MKITKANNHPLTNAITIADIDIEITQITEAIFSPNAP